MMVSSTNDPVRVQCRNSRTPPGAPRGRSVRGKARADQHVSPLFPELGLLAEHSLLDEARLARDSARSQVVRLEVQLHPLDAQLGKGVVAGEVNGATGEASIAVLTVSGVEDAGYQPSRRACSSSSPARCASRSSSV